MKFVFFGYDFMIHVVRRLLEDGHECMALFSFPCDGVFNFNAETARLASDLNIPFSTGKPAPAEMEDFISKGANLFLAAGYPYKIPPIDENKAYALNCHPSYLPMGRGLMPTPYILMNAPQAAGFTVHKIAPAFDAGDILVQHKIEISTDESVETYSAKIALKALEIIPGTVNNIAELWAQAEPQNESKASTFPAPDDKMRLLNFNNPLEDILKHHRAFGRFGVLAHLAGTTFAVYELRGWHEAHTQPAGHIILYQEKMIVLTCQDGFVCLTDFQRL